MSEIVDLPPDFEVYGWTLKDIRFVKNWLASRAEGFRDGENAAILKTEAYEKGFADCRQKAIEAINGWTYDKRGHTNLADLIASFLPSEGGSK